MSGAGWLLEKQGVTLRAQEKRLLLCFPLTVAVEELGLSDVRATHFPKGSGRLDCPIKSHL